MAKDDHPIIDMTLEGEFVSAPQPPTPPAGARVLLLWAVVGMILAATALIVVLTLWFVVMVLPVVLGAALVAYLAFRYQQWRARHSFGIRRGPGGWPRA